MDILAPTYIYTQKGRSLFTVLVSAFVAILAILFFASRNPVFAVMGVFFAVLVFSGIYSFLKGETWRLSVEGGILTWSYARGRSQPGALIWETSAGFVVNDCSSSLLFTFLDGSTRKIRLIGPGTRFRDYLVAHFPHINVEFVAGT